MKTGNILNKKIEYKDRGYLDAFVIAEWIRKIEASDNGMINDCV